VPLQRGPDRAGAGVTEADRPVKIPVATVRPSFDKISLTTRSEELESTTTSAARASPEGNGQVNSRGSNWPD